MGTSSPSRQEPGLAQDSNHSRSRVLACGDPETLVVNSEGWRARIGRPKETRSRAYVRLERYVLGRTASMLTGPLGT